MIRMMIMSLMMSLMKVILCLYSQEGNLLKTRGSVGTGAPLEVKLSESDDDDDFDNCDDCDDDCGDDCDDNCGDDQDDCRDRHFFGN